VLELPNTHCNYVIAFTDGSVKVGVTSRPHARVAELRRLKRGSATLCAGMFTPLAPRAAAFKTEADLCRLLSYRRLEGTREWFQGENQFSYFKGTTGMFWQLNNFWSRLPYIAIEITQ
jgi:hypothetical protein